MKAKLAAAKSQEVVIPRKTESRANIQEKNQVVVVTEQNMKDRRRRELLEKKKLAFLGDRDDRWVVVSSVFNTIYIENYTIFQCRRWRYTYRVFFF